MWFRPRATIELHPQGINVYLRERDGIRLTAARTLEPKSVAPTNERPPVAHDDQTRARTTDAMGGV